MLARSSLDPFGVTLSQRFRSLHQQARDRLAGLETELRRDDLHTESRGLQHALNMLARMAVATTRAERIRTIVLATNQFLDCEEVSVQRAK